MIFDPKEIESVMLRNRRARALVNSSTFGLLALGSAIVLIAASEPVMEVIAGMAFGSAAALAAQASLDAYRTHIKITENAEK